MRRTPRSSCPPLNVAGDVTEDATGLPTDDAPDGSASHLSRFCKKCLYPLDGLASKYCPECGRWFHRDWPHTFYHKPRRPMYRPKAMTVLVCSLFVLAVIIGVGIERAFYLKPLPPIKMVGFNHFVNGPQPFRRRGGCGFGPNRGKFLPGGQPWPRGWPGGDWTAESLHRQVIPATSASKLEFVGFVTPAPWDQQDFD